MRLLGGPRVVLPHRHIIMLMLLEVVEIPDQMVVFISDGKIVSLKFWVEGHEIDAEHIVYHDWNVMSLGFSTEHNTRYTLTTSW